MAVPKGKVSKARRDKRRANWKVTVKTLVECPHCHELWLLWRSTSCWNRKERNKIIYLNKSKHL